MVPAIRYNSRFRKKLDFSIIVFLNREIFTPIGARNKHLDLSVMT